MKIEGDYITLSTGKKINADGGMVGLDNDMDINVYQERDGISLSFQLTDQEKWELARFMIDRWMDVRDKLWEAHENTLNDLVEAVSGQESVKERVESDTEKLIRGDSYMAPIIKTEGPFEPMERGLEEELKPYVTEEHTSNLVEIADQIRNGTNITITGIKCGVTTCKQYDEAFTDHCGLKTNDRDGCFVWSDLVLRHMGGDKPKVVEDPPFRCRCVVTPVAEIVNCPVPDCFYIFDNACSYAHPQECGIRLNYINGMEVELNYKGVKEATGEHSCGDDSCSCKKKLYYSDEGAQYLMNKVHPCPQCTSDTTIGLHKLQPNCWETVEPRYCPTCGWKEASDIGKGGIQIDEELIEEKAAGIPLCFCRHGHSSKEEALDCEKAIEERRKAEEGTH